MQRNKLYLSLVFLILWTFAACAQTDQNINWNDEQLIWHSYEEGMKVLKEKKSVGLFIIYADWCPTCKAYSKLFSHPAVVKSLQGITLIRANMDKEPEISALYDKDGTYVPRTFALNQAGKLIKPMHPDKDKFDYFLPVEYPGVVVNFATHLKSYLNH